MKNRIRVKSESAPSVVQENDSWLRSVDTTTIPDGDLLHLEAGQHADHVAAQSIEFRRKNGMKPYELFATREHWLMRYESYRAGVIAERARRAGEVHARGMHAGGRRAGRTFAMVKNLTADVRFIVVHTAQMKDYVERMLWDVRRDLIHNSVRRPHVVVVQSTRDCDRLRGQKIVVDHAVLEFASPEVHGLLRALERK